MKFSVVQDKFWPPSGRTWSNKARGIDQTQPASWKTRKKKSSSSLGEFGLQDPVALQRTLWWFLSMHFGFRARDESRKLRWGDVKLDRDPQTNREVLVWAAERGSKTRQGLDGGHRRVFDPKAFATGTNRCPVQYYKVFESHRPEKAKDPELPFFLAVNLNWRQSQNALWYKSSPLRKNQIGNFLSKAARSAGLQLKNKKVANHSVRKTSIFRFLDAGVPKNFVTQLSGHKNIRSLTAYKSASSSLQRSMSELRYVESRQRE